MYYVTATLDRFERGRAVLRFEDGQELILPKRKLPARIREGAVLHCEFFLDADQEKRRANIARYLLEEILHTHGKNTKD